MYRQFALPCVVMLTLLMCQHSSCGQDQTGQQGQPVTPAGGPEVPVGEQPTSDSPEVTFQRTAEFGFVFLESGYVPAPYLVQATADSVTINGHPVPLRIDLDQDDIERADLDPGDVDAAPHRGFHRRGRLGRFPGWERAAYRRAAFRIADELDAEPVMIAFPGQPPEYIYDLSDQYVFLKALLDHDFDSDEFHQFLNERATPEEQSVMKNWVQGLLVTDELRDRAHTLVEQVGAAEEKNLSEIRANRRLDAMAYPMTVLGMVLGILALGHLLKSFSKMENSEQGTLPSSEVLRATGVSIGLMVALSLFDLTWTVLASQAGVMKELNPLGSQMISDPTMLIAFKLAATFVGCGVLYALRRHERARRACWWLCLICTVLTFRWVMFNSMFVA